MKDYVAIDTSTGQSLTRAPVTLQEAEAHARTRPDVEIYHYLDDCISYTHEDGWHRPCVQTPTAPTCPQHACTDGVRAGHAALLAVAQDPQQRDPRLQKLLERLVQDAEYVLCLLDPEHAPYPVERDLVEDMLAQADRALGVAFMAIGEDTREQRATLAEIGEARRDIERAQRNARARGRGD